MGEGFLRVVEVKVVFKGSYSRSRCGVPGTCRRLLKFRDLGCGGRFGEFKVQGFRI